MEKHNYLPVLQEILASNALDRLDEFKEPSLWTQMSFDERELLAMLFTLQGERILSTNDQKALEIFVLALRIAPSNAQIFYRQGLAWLGYAKRHHQERCLSLASQNMQKATSFNPAFTDAWICQANILVEMGKAFGDLTHFQEADEKFEHAALLTQGSADAMANLNWDWANCWLYLGRHSGEAIDFRTALEKFEEAALLGCKGAAFWNDYGNALLGMADLMETPLWYKKAEEIFRMSVQQTPDDCAGWYYLGLTLFQLFKLSQEEEHFFQAKEALATSLKLNSHQVQVWLLLGLLCLSQGKLMRDIYAIEESIEKFAEADRLQVGHPVVQSRWAEALMLLGVYTENLSLLKEAERKLHQATGNFPDNFEIWHAYATCLFELGRYFNDEEYLLQAVEKFQYGLSLDGNQPFLWHGLSQAHFALGEMHGDFLMIEQAAYYCSRACELQPNNTVYLVDWGVSLLKMGELTNLKQYIEEAMQKLECALKLKGGVWQTNDAELLYHYGCCLDFFGDLDNQPSFYEKAIATLQRALELDPDFTHAKYNIALAYAHLGEVLGEGEPFNKAIEYFRRLIEEDSEDEQVWNDWGLALLNLSEITRDIGPQPIESQLREEAESKFLQAASLGCASAFYNLACLFSLKGNYATAVYFLEKADYHGGLPALDDVLCDEWLEPLRQTELFRQFVSQMKNKSRI